MSLEKICADHIRSFYESLFAQKLKASHAHEIVAAAFGYKTAAALKQDESFCDIVYSDYIVLDKMLVKKRLTQLSDLPEISPDPEDIALEIGNFIRFEQNSSALIYVSDGPDLEKFLLRTIIDEHLSFRSLSRLAPVPTDPQGLMGLAYCLPIFDESNLVEVPFSIMDEAEIELERDERGTDAFVRFDADHRKLNHLPYSETNHKLWFEIHGVIVPYAGRTGYRLINLVLSNPRHEHLCLLDNAATLNLRNAFDNPAPGDLDNLFSYPPDLNTVSEPLPEGAVLTIYDENLYPARLSDGRPNRGTIEAHKREREEGLPPDSLNSDWLLRGLGSRCPYASKRSSPVSFTSCANRSWSDAIIELNHLRALKEPVNIRPRQYFIDKIERTGHANFTIHCGT
jgi:hypothetical protein